MKDFLSLYYFYYEIMFCLQVIIVGKLAYLPLYGRDIRNLNY